MKFYYGPQGRSKMHEIAYKLTQQYLACPFCTPTSTFTLIQREGCGTLISHFAHKIRFLLFMHAYENLVS